MLLALWSAVGRHRDAAQALPVSVRELSDAMPRAALHIAEYDAEQVDFSAWLDWTATGGLRLRPDAQARGGGAAAGATAVGVGAAPGELQDPWSRGERRPHELITLSAPPGTGSVYPPGRRRRA